MFQKKFMVVLVFLNYSFSAHSESFAVLERGESGYKLSSTILMKDETKSSMFRSTWPFKTSNLDPAFNTNPFECVINTATKVDGCSQYRNKEVDFIHVNNFQSSYRTPLSQRKPITAGSVAGTALVGVIAAPVVIFMSPFLLLGAATNVESKKWVEFNHDEFNSRIQNALKNSGFNSSESFMANMSQIDRMLYELNKLSNDLKEQFISDQQKEVAVDLNHFLSVGIKSNAVDYKYKLFQLPSIPLIYDSNFEKSVAESILENDFQNRLKFKDIKNSEVPDLLIKYENYLIKEKERVQAEKIEEEDRRRRIKIAEDEERKRRDLQDKIDQKKFAIENLRIEKFRTQIQPGDDIHCGMIIEIKGSMLKIAINVPIQGYAGEAWIRKSDAFPVDYGCSNRNGRLSTLRSFISDRN